MNLPIIAQSELELRKRKQKNKSKTAPARWDKWLQTLFPKHFNKPFAQRHVEFWQWVDSIRPGIRPRPFFAIWGRGGAKSQSAEGAVIKIAAKGIRHYAWYVSSTQDKADQHVESIGSMLESSEVNKYYPEIAERAVNKYGNSRGWRRNRLRTASGFTIDAMGLDTGARGGKSDEHRPDFICHQIGTSIFTDGIWMNVEDHDTAGVRNGDGNKIHVWGIPFSETVTPEHRYWTRSITPIPKSNQYNISPDGWCESKDLTTRHYIGLPIDTKIGPFESIPYYYPKIGERNSKGQVVRGVSNFESKVPDEFIDPEWWWFFGLWWGDGHAVGKHIIGITIADSQPKIFDRMISLLNNWNIKYNLTKRPGCQQITFSHSAFCRWLKSWRVGNSRKQPPQWVEYLQEKYLAELIRGYVDADGFIDHKNQAVRITSIHLDGLLCVRRLLMRFGIAASIRKGAGPRTEKFPNGITSISQTKYDLRFRDGASQFGYDIPDSKRYAFSRTFCDNGYLWVRVRRIEKVQGITFVPITTKNHEYLTHFGKSHNCIDDVDELFDSFAVTKKKIDTLSKTILPAGSNDCAILFIQNLITPDSIASRLLDNRADFISDKIISGPYPAIENMEYEQRDGKYIITGGKPTWAGQDLEVAQSQIVTWGFSPFMQEAQHEVDKTGGIWDNVDFQHFEYKDKPDYVRTAVWVDPAVSSTDESDSMGISAGGIRSDDTIDGLYWWEDITTPEDAIERAIRKAVEIKSLTVGVETDQGGDTWKSVYARALESVKAKMQKDLSADQYNAIKWPTFKDVKAGGTNEETGHAYGSKVERNSKMLTDYENGRVRHMIGTHKTIESALRRFPRKPLDVADSWFWTVHDLTKGKINWVNTKGLGKVENYKSKWE